MGWRYPFPCRGAAAHGTARYHRPTSCYRAKDFCMAQLALLGGKPAVRDPIALYRTVGAEDEAAVLRVMREGVLSAFLGSWSPEFYYGGPEVQAFEAEWKAAFNCAHALSVN